MKKLFSCLFIGILTIPFLGNKSKADENYFHNDGGNSSNSLIEIIKSSVNGDTNELSVITTFDRSLNNNVRLEDGWVDNSLGKIFFKEENSSYESTGRLWTYSISEDLWSVGSLTEDSSYSESELDLVEISANPYTSVKTNTSNISTNTANISTNTANISTNTSNIKNLGEGVAGSTALTAALTALPQTAKESKLSCGVGTGAYSSRYAVGFGCASKVNERVDINAGGSYVFGGSKSYGGGTLDSGVVKAGFVFKLGELSKPTQISFNDKKIIDKKLSTLEENNKNLNAELKLSKAKNDEIISQNQKLLARLEKLENIALKFQSSSEMISVATKD